ncbi:MAG: DUF1553 domain-containing protein [Planctomycetes bacterium]|nr:DUF1553 domain-containing protein [Planctomycetota bacterium]
MQIAVGVVAGILASPSVAQDAGDRSGALEFFERRIRPVLAQECYECHSSTGARKGGLALDERESARRGGSSGPAIVPGAPEESLLWQAIRQTHPVLKMPKGRAALSAAVVADFATWIRDGALDPRDAPPSASELAADTDWSARMQRRLLWWSFRPLRARVAEELPSDVRRSWIDRYLEEQLAEQGLAVAPRAEPEVLLRRLSFALRGLPPTIAELRAMEGELEPDAFGRLVDEWLDSPRFGERWARHWMDWLRYADSHGSEGDAEIPYAWRYRDYLIRALNQDVGYDQLLREHLAGDLLPAPRIDPSTGRNESSLGTAHLRMVYHGYAPTDALEERLRFTDDQIDVVGKAFLGLTVSCARCHDHKFDPISQQDYTALYGVFSSCAPAILDARVIDQGQAAARARLADAQLALRGALAERYRVAANQLAERLRGDEDALRTAIERATQPSDVLHPFHLLRKQQSAAPLAAWRQRPTNAGPSAVRAWNLAHELDLVLWRRSGLGVQRSSRAGSFAVAAEGERVLHGIYPAGTYSHLASTRDRGVLISPIVDLGAKFDLWVRVAGDGGAALRPVVQHYPRDGSVFPIHSLRGGAWSWVKFDLEYWSGDEIHVELATAADQPVLASPNAVHSWFGVREVRLQPRGTPEPAQDHAFAAPLLDMLGEREPATAVELASAYAAATFAAVEAWSASRASDEQALWLDALLRAELLPNKVEQLDATAASALMVCRELMQSELAAPERVPGLLETEPRDAPLLVRGDHRTKGPSVPRRSLSAFGGAPLAVDASGRRELAEDWLRAENPLVARVIVNRVWHHLFGRGLVATTDNFGHMGGEPSHPELLDQLARELVAEGWSLKKLIRKILCSAAWQRSSVPPPGSRERDPENRWLSHFPLRRLEAEAIRDSLLAVSGELDPTLLGPPVPGDSLRRSIYVSRKRNAMDPFLGAFDAPVPASAKGQRDATNVPAQSLALLNDPFVLQRAERWAQLLAADPALQDPGRRVEAMFLAAFARLPSAAERARALAYVERSSAERSAAELQRQAASEVLREAERRNLELSNLALERVRAFRREPSAPSAETLPRPLATWSFEGETHAASGALHAELHGGARLLDGALVLDGQSGYAASAPLEVDLGEKTLMAWVQLDQLTQRGGGVISVQTLDGERFDAIVFGEREPQRWLAGSDTFSRTQAFGGAEEQDARERAVHLAITYAADGTITAYRDGERYGEPYRSRGPFRFLAGQSQVLFGLRHGTPSGDRVLQGRIHHAALFDRALSGAEVRQLAEATGELISSRALLEALTPAEREERAALVLVIAARTRELEELESTKGASSAFADLSHALFNHKEFLYVR